MDTEKTDRLKELQLKAAENGGMDKALDDAEKAEFSSLKSEYEVEQARLAQEEKAEQENAPEPQPAGKKGTITLPKKELAAIMERLESLEKDSGTLDGRLTPGEEVPVQRLSKERYKLFPRYREDSNQEWMYIVDQKWMNCKWDKDMKKDVNYFEIILMNVKGETKKLPADDSSFARMFQNHESLKMTNPRHKEFETQDAVTPWVVQRKTVQDNSPKSVTGFKVVEMGKVPNIVTKKKTRYTIHMPHEPGEQEFTFEVMCDSKGMHLMSEKDVEKWDAM